MESILYKVAMCGNPNTGKSTVFNALTGLNQHTGNWAGKTVESAVGYYKKENTVVEIVDLPGVYSLFSSIAEERYASDFILRENPDCIIVMLDATNILRGLTLLLQVLQMKKRVVVCLNLMDEANKKHIEIDYRKLSDMLNVKIIPTSARTRAGISELINAVIDKSEAAENPCHQLNYDVDVENAIERISSVLKYPEESRFVSLSLLNGLYDVLEQYGLSDNVKEALLTEIKDYQNDLSCCIGNTIYETSEKIHNECVLYKKEDYDSLERTIDSIILSKRYGIPIMIAMLAVVFFITVYASNILSAYLAAFFSFLEIYVRQLLSLCFGEGMLKELLIDGVYHVVTWIVSVMLPPMAIFFPIFTLMEDSGILPRIAFNLDHLFKINGAHGKQALSMCMGFGCNACGVSCARIISSERERLLAIITNSFVPCNGRFPGLIMLTSLFIVGTGSYVEFKVALVVLLFILLSVLITLFVSGILSKTMLKGVPSEFTLELPPYRKPVFKEVIIRSLLDRTIFVLLRAITVAVPAGILIWCLQNVIYGDVSVLTHIIRVIDPIARQFGMDGVILVAFLLGLPANEIVIPLMFVCYNNMTGLTDASSLTELNSVFIKNGWTIKTALCVMLFSLNHYPCATTLLTIKKETNSLKWTVVSFLVPTIIGLILCFFVNIML